MNLVQNYQIFVKDPEQVIFLHEAQGHANPFDIAFDVIRLGPLHTAGWYNSSVLGRQDTVEWKKLSWSAEVPPGARLHVFFRAGRISSPLDPYDPSREITNGQTENLPLGREAQWRVEFEGLPAASPILYDLIGEFSPKTGVVASPEAPPFTFKLLPNFPNPIRARTTIAYELPVMTEATIYLYNLNGRQLRAWHFVRQPAGRHSFVWDGADESGVHLANGVYFLKLIAGSQQRLRKIVVVR